MLVCIYPPSIYVCRNKDSRIFVVRLNAWAVRKLVRVQYLVSAAKSQHCEGGEAGGRREGGWGTPAKWSAHYGNPGSLLGAAAASCVPAGSSRHQPDTHSLI